MAEILIVCGAGYVSGKEIMALELGRGLAQSHRPVTFVTSFWNNGDFLGRLKRANISAFSLPIGFISATFTKECLRMTVEQVMRWPGLLWQYRCLLRTRRPIRIIHTNWHHLLLLSPYLRPQRDFFWIHELVPDRQHYRRVFGWLARSLGAFICVSQAVACSLRQLGIAERKIRVIHNGLSDPAADFLHRKRPADGRFRVGLVGQVGPWKGHDDILEAIAFVQQRYPGVVLDVFGEGEPGYKEVLRGRCIELGIADAVEWHDFVTDRPRIYANLDACVVPSRAPDPLPTTALEAGFFGLPVVATRRGGLPEIIEHEVNGLLVEAERPEELAAAICRLIEEPGLKDQMAANARIMVLERFGHERFTKDFIRLLEETN